MISISFSSRPVPPEPDSDLDTPMQYVVVVIDGVSTTFLAPMNYWETSEYIEQWKEGIERILVGEASSCLLTGVRNPALHEGVTMMELHRVEDEVFARERYVFADRVPQNFDPRDPYELVGPHPAIHVEATGEVRVIQGTRVALTDVAELARMLESGAGLPGR